MYMYQTRALLRKLREDFSAIVAWLDFTTPRTACQQNIRILSDLLPFVSDLHRAL